MTIDYTFFFIGDSKIRSATNNDVTSHLHEQYTVEHTASKMQAKVKEVFIFEQVVDSDSFGFNDPR